jgi:hypothetical protein
MWADVFKNKHTRGGKLYIYIDESGNFAHSKGCSHSLSCAGALTIPGRNHGKVLKSFGKLKKGAPLFCVGK